MKVLQHQFWHLIVLIFLLGGVYYSVQLDEDVLSGQLWGLSTKSWFIITLLVPIVHQIYVLVFWRLELYYNTVTDNLGEKGFGLYKAGFTVLILARPVSIICLAVANAWTMSINPLLSYGLSAVLLLPAIYLAYSIRKYFGIDRAFGIDHFEPDLALKGLQLIYQKNYTLIADKLSLLS